MKGMDKKSVFLVLVFFIFIYRDYCIEMNLYILLMVLGIWKSVC